ncbi:hypothetical protein GGR54DRAFT_617389 [Hypoxylon sp. NC1633]|nr:hypothetical protein GGR54DRAFT_617389 [Hypoxylon sp. NC1633]
MEVMSRSLQGPTQDFWPAAFLQVFSELSRRGTATVLRVALLSYRLPISPNSFDREGKDFVVNVGNTRQPFIPAGRQITRQQPPSSAADTPSLKLLEVADFRRSRGRLKASARRQRN